MPVSGGTGKRARGTLRSAAALSLLLALAACAVGPDYVRPQARLPASYQPLPGWEVAATDADSAPKGDWWTLFADPLLDELAPAVATSNQTVAQAYANYQAATADIRAARSALFPTLGVSAAASRQRTVSGAAVGGTPPRIGNNSSVEAGVSWAPDLWGGVRRSVEASRANADASAAALANVILSQQVALASAVTGLRFADAGIRLLDRTVAAYAESLKVVENQDRAGTVPPSDMLSARVQLRTAEARRQALGIARAQYAHAIAVLVGRNPGSLPIPAATALPAIPDVPAGVPATLLQRRPDIAVAERQMAAQNALIGVAKAPFFPSVSLSATGGVAQSPVAGLLHLADSVWSVGADIGELLFDGGRRQADVAAARARYAGAVASYRGTVLGALQNVEDDLAGLRILAEQAGTLADAVADATRAAEIARNEYAAGTVDFTTVAVAEAAQLQAEQDALGVQQQRVLDSILLIGDLGGGWSVGQLHTTPALVHPAAD